MTEPLAPTRGVLFDMDGVIIDSRSVVETTWASLARRHRGRDLSAEEIHEHVHGRSGAHTVATLFPDLGPEEQRAIWSEADRMEESADYPVIPGVRDVIDGLARCGVALGLVTSGWPEKIRHVLGLLGAPTLFTAVISREDVGNAKPHPEPYRKGCAALGLEPDQVVVFEDASSGVRSAVAAGTRCIGIGGAELVEGGAFAAVHDFTALRVDADAAGGAVLTGVVPAVALRPRSP